MVVYIMEVKVRVASDREEWRAVHPSHDPIPYLFDSESEALDSLHRCYGAPEMRHKARVRAVELTDVVTA